MTRRLFRLVLLLVALVVGCSSHSSTGDASSHDDAVSGVDQLLAPDGLGADGAIDSGQADLAGDPQDAEDDSTPGDGIESDDATKPDSQAPDSVGDATLPSCPAVSDATTLGTVTSNLLPEISGLVVSRSQPGVLFAHNDSGDSATFYALDRTGALTQRFRLQDETAIDWEDIAIGPAGGSGDSLFLGDIGDNSQSRPSIRVLIVPEPKVDGSVEELSIAANTIRRLVLHYPGAKQNCEAMIVDPANGDIYLIAKQTSGAAQIFRKSAPHSDGEDVTLELVGTLGVPNTLVTAADISADGTRILVRTYNKAFLWERDGAGIVETLSRPTCSVPLPKQPQGEAIAFEADGSGYLTISEGLSQPLYRLEFVP